jgi:hypothetical protein
LLGVIVGIGAIALAIWLLQGSSIARTLLIVLSIIGFVVYVANFFLTVGDSWLDPMLLAVLAVLSAYCLWQLAFSEDLRAELASRRQQRVK